MDWTTVIIALISLIGGWLVPSPRYGKKGTGK
jgi:hypothetical protein